MNLYYRQNFVIPIIAHANLNPVLYSSEMIRLVSILFCITLTNVHILGQRLS